MSVKDWTNLKLIDTLIVETLAISTGQGANRVALEVHDEILLRLNQAQPPCSECATPSMEEINLPWTVSGDSPSNPPMVWDVSGDSIVNQMPDGTPYFEPEVAAFIGKAANSLAAHETECATLRKERDEARAAVKYECEQKAIAIEQSLADSDRAEAAEAQLSTLRDALKAIRIALKEPAGGEYWTARKFLDERGIYHGDLDDLRVLNKVAEAALAPTPEVAPVKILRGQRKVSLELEHESETGTHSIAEVAPKK